MKPAPGIGFNVTYVCPDGMVFDSDWFAKPFVLMTCQVNSFQAGQFSFLFENYCFLSVKYSFLPGKYSFLFENFCFLSVKYRFFENVS